eukprot:1161078-Pelagomonas_calceolata.AAC.28
MARRRHGHDWNRQHSMDTTGSHGASCTSWFGGAKTSRTKRTAVRLLRARNGCRSMICAQQMQGVQRAQ